jgi:hypothetical protein
MKLFMFKSEAQRDLHAFAADSSGVKLPEKFGPWTATGVIRADKSPPHGFSRPTIEAAVDTQGFQLWRKKAKEPSS